MVEEKKAVTFLLAVLIPASALTLYPESLVHGVEIPIGILFSFVVWNHKGVARGVFLIYCCVFMADLLIVRVNEYISIFAVSFLLIMYELIDFSDFYETSDNEGLQKAAMRAHLSYLARLFVGCSVLPALIVVVARLSRFGAGGGAFTFLIFSLMVLFVIMTLKYVSR